MLSSEKEKEMTSFEFKWTNKDKHPGKVFNLKKTKVTKPKFQSKTSSEKVTVTESKKVVKGRNENRQTINPKFVARTALDSEKNVENSAFIKRKGKKDKTKNKNDSGGFSKTSLDKLGPKHHSLFSEKYKNVHINTNMKGISVVEKVFSAGKKFSELDIHKHIISNLEKHQFTILTNVQEKSIPTVLSGKNCLIRSQTGSGKTLTYAVPILNTLINITPKIKRNCGIQVVIIVPTRELALQTHELFEQLNTFQWIIVGHLCGGENRKTEKDKLRRGVHILIGTPGRLLDHILHTAAFNAKHVCCLVLDEADRLLDMGFKKDIVRFVEELDSQKKNASHDPMALLKRHMSGGTLDNNSQSEPNNMERQTLLLSATLTKEIADLADFTMKEHVYIDALDESTTTNPDHMIIPNTVKQEFILTFVKHRLTTLSALLITKSKQNSKVIVFMATSHMVDFHYELFKNFLLKMPLNRGKVKVGNVLLLDEMELDDSDEEEQVLDVELFRLHGSMNQQERKTVFGAFRKAKRGILLCTDVAARGIDVPEADCIVQYTGPQSDDDYLHRVGRTGRAGKSGSAIIFLTHEEQDFITHLQGHKVFLKEYDTDAILRGLAKFMDEPDNEKGILALQRRYETSLSKNEDLHRKACLAYSSWLRFYSSFPSKMKSIFDLKKVNVGHYVTSFGLQESPTTVAKIAKGRASKIESHKLNRKLANHEDNEELRKPRQKRPIKSISLTASEFSSGLKPAKKKRKNNPDV